MRHKTINTQTYTNIYCCLIKRCFYTVKCVYRSSIEQAKKANEPPDNYFSIFSFNQFYINLRQHKMYFYQKSIVENLFNSMAGIDQNHVWHVYYKRGAGDFSLPLSVHIVTEETGLSISLSSLSSTMIYRCFLSLLSLLKKVVNPLPVCILKFLYFSYREVQEIKDIG